VIDSHCHLAGGEFAADLEAVVARATAAGVESALVIVGAEDDDECARADIVTGTWPSARLSIGVHPHTAGRFGDNAAAAATLVEARLAAKTAARAVGEIGLDYHYDFAPREAQQAVFQEQVALAYRLNLPIVIHTREAEDDTFRILQEAGGTLRGVFHCFTGDRAMARRALDTGFHLSLAGIVTFPRATELHEVAKLVPLDRLLVETDSPFLAPVPHRGTRNEPARVVHVADAIARLRGTSAAAVADAARENFIRLFNP
jgi:TatD DNase family protein